MLLASQDLKAMIKLELRIGTRLGLAAGLAVVLALGLVANQQVGSGLVTKSQAVADRQSDIDINLLHAEIAIRGAALATRALRTAPTIELIEKSTQEAHESLGAAVKYLDEAMATT